MKMKKLTSLCGCLLLSMCMGVGAMTAPLSAEAAAREKVILDADMVDLFDDGIAMMMLAESPKMDLKGVTIVIGNRYRFRYPSAGGHRPHRYPCIYGR